MFFQLPFWMICALKSFSLASIKDWSLKSSLSTCRFWQHMTFEKAGVNAQGILLYQLCQMYLEIYWTNGEVTQGGKSWPDSSKSCQSGTQACKSLPVMSFTWQAKFSQKIVISSYFIVSWLPQSLHVVICCHVSAVSPLFSNNHNFGLRNTPLSQEIWNSCQSPIAGGPEVSVARLVERW